MSESHESETFPREEHLKSRKAIRLLFDRGYSLKSFPIKLQWLPAPNDQGIKAGFSAPKKQFPKATARNRIKRLMRETYRKNKSILFQSDRKSGLHLMFIYIASEELPYGTINDAMHGILNTLVEQSRE